MALGGDNTFTIGSPNGGSPQQAWSQRSRASAAFSPRIGLKQALDTSHKGLGERAGRQGLLTEPDEIADEIPSFSYMTGAGGRS